MLNRLTKLVDAVGTSVYSYDAAGQLLSEGGLWPNDTVSITYANRLRTSLGIASPTGPEWSQTYGYDATRRLTSTTSPAGAFDYIYNPLEMQRVDTLTLPNGAAITNGYDSSARLTMSADNSYVVSAYSFGQIVGATSYDPKNGSWTARFRPTT